MPEELAPPKKGVCTLPLLNPSGVEREGGSDVSARLRTCYQRMKRSRAHRGGIAVSPGGSSAGGQRRRSGQWTWPAGISPRMIWAIQDTKVTTIPAKAEANMRSSSERCVLPRG